MDKRPTIKRIPWVDWPSCDPNTLTKKIKNGEAITDAYHCKRMTCDKCGAAIAKFRAENLLYALRKDELTTVWFGEADPALLKAARNYANRHPGTKRLLTTYLSAPDLRTLLVTANVAKRREGVLLELPIEEAAYSYWWAYADEYGLCKNPHDDWKISEYSKVEWVDSGPQLDVIKTDEKMDRLHGYVPGETIEDVDTYKRKFRRIRSSITNPPAPDLPADYPYE